MYLFASPDPPKSVKRQSAQARATGLGALGARLIQALALVPLAIAVATGPTQAAETLEINYDLLSRSIPVASLEDFAASGTVDRALGEYFHYLNVDQAQQAQIREMLSSPRQVDLVAISQSLYTPMGTLMLAYAGQVIKTGAGQNGQIALRAAITEAAADPAGLSLINVLRAFPTETVALDLSMALANVQLIQQLLEQTQQLTAFVTSQSQLAAAQSKVDYASLASDPLLPGPFAVVGQGLTLADPSRDRAYPVQLFLPQMPAPGLEKLPVIVISHGLGDTRATFYPLAQHLASYGFAVALPEHIGSNVEVKTEVLSGVGNEFFSVDEFIDRPRDVSFLLDELERLNATEYGGRLDLTRVGAIGHSFGGYTVLALAGATVDFDWLAQACDPSQPTAVSLALLLECRALELPPASPRRAQLSQTGLGDERIKLVMAMNPVSYLFGETGMARIQVPTVMGAGAYDFVTPVIPEQAMTFAWLPVVDKYFLLAEQRSHNSEVTQVLLQYIYGVQDDAAIEQAQDWLRSDFNALMVAFAQVYLNGQEDYRPFIQSAYVEQMGEAPFLLHLVQSLELL